MIRAMMPRDLESVKRIHEKYYGEEFNLPDFVTNYLCAFVALDGTGRIVSAGGIRTILESVLVTDKSFNPEVRKAALLEILSASLYFARQTNHDGIHAFIQDEKWASRLIRTGFKDTTGRALYFGLPNKETNNG